jgi:uncharacterized protein YaeQ
MRLQATINKIEDRAKKWRIKRSQNKSTHIIFTLRNQTCPTFKMVNVDLSQNNEMKYLGMHLDRRLTWTKHIKSKINQANLKSKQCTGSCKKINTINRRAEWALPRPFCIYKFFIIRK